MLETLSGMNDMNTQMQIRSIISAPVLHPTVAHPSISTLSNGNLGTQLITMDLQSEVTELATNLVNDGSIDHFMVAQGILNQVDNDGKITLLIRKQDTLKMLLERKLQKLQEAPWRSANTNPLFSTANVTFQQHSLQLQQYNSTALI